MGRLLVIVGLIGVIAWWVMARLRGGRGRDATPPQGADAARPPAAGPGSGAPQEIVACAHCGLNLPRQEAVADEQGRPYCGDAHRLAGPR
jgi:uncharacterized protein